MKDLWYHSFINSPQAEISTRQSLANLRETSKTHLRIERENEERHEENERRKQERLRKIKEENKNLEWPKPDLYAYVKIRKPFDYWRNGCLYCTDYKPRTTHDYEVHIVTRHHGRPAYPGPPDLEKYRILRESKSKVVEAAAANVSGDGVMFGDKKEPQKWQE